MVSGAVVDDHHVVQPGYAVLLRLHVKGLDVQQRLADGRHYYVAEHHFGPALAEERDLLGNRTVCLDGGGNQVGAVHGLARRDRVGGELAVVVRVGRRGHERGQVLLVTVEDGTNGWTRTKLC